MNDNKIIKQRFQSSVKRGTGEAFLIMKSNPAVDFSSDIIKASLKNYAYDGQSEGSRTAYISELISLSKQQNNIRNAILNGLANEQNDTWTLVQLFELAAFFAKHGDTDARKAIYKRFYKKIINGSDWCGYASIIELDGLSGLEYIAITIGKSLEKNPEGWQDSSIIRHFQKDNPTIKVIHELENLAKDNRFIKGYLDNLKRTEDERKNYQKPVVKVNYKIVNERINDEKRTIAINANEAKQLIKTDIKKLANDLLTETNRQKLAKYMCIFDRVKYPYHYSPILEIVKTKNVKGERLVEYASGALRHFSGSDIRKFAIDTLSKTKKPSDYLNLLVSNYKKGDSKLLTTIAKNCKNEDDLHAVVYTFINIYTANKIKECKVPLETVYEKLTCGIHRHEIIKILINNKALSKKIKAAIKHDSYQDTRLLSSKP